jgi:hypothetical protein
MAYEAIPDIYVLRFFAVGFPSLWVLQPGLSNFSENRFESPSQAN